MYVLMKILSIEIKGSDVLVRGSDVG